MRILYPVDLLKGIFTPKTYDHSLVCYMYQKVEKKEPLMPTIKNSTIEQKKQNIAKTETKFSPTMRDW